MNGQQSPGKFIIILITLTLIASLQCKSSVEPVILGKSETHFKKENLKKIPEMWEDGIRTTMEPGTFEWWYFDAHLDDGSVVVITFLTKSLINVNSGPVPTIDVRIVGPNGTRYTEFETEPLDRFNASKEKCDITIGKNRAVGDLTSYTVYTKTRSIVCDLKFERLNPSWRPGVGKWYFGNDEKHFFAWFPSVPYASVTGEVTYNGKKRKVTGSGYHDHNWGNVEMSDVWNNWWWSRTQIGGYTIIAVELTAAKKYGYKKLPIFMMAKDNKILADDESKMVLNRFETIKHPQSEKPIENKLEFVYRDQKYETKLTLKRKEDINIYDFTSDLPGWKRFIATVLGVSPWYHRVKGSANLEVRANGKKESYAGESVYELMYLGKSLE